MAPPQAWSDKDERKYEHIKKSALDSGKSKDRAEEIAAATVNRDRRDEGRTLDQKSDQARLENRTIDKLRERARELDIDGRSSMSKDELIAAIRKANG